MQREDHIDNIILTVDFQLREIQSGCQNRGELRGRYWLNGYEYLPKFQFY